MKSRDHRVPRTNPGTRPSGQKEPTMTAHFTQHLIVVVAIVTLFIALRPATTDSHDSTPE